MSFSKNGTDRSSKNIKSPTRLSGIINSGSSKSQISNLVPPVLRDVGKLAAGVASVNTLSTQNVYSGSATGKLVCLGILLHGILLDTYLATYLLVKISIRTKVITNLKICLKTIETILKLRIKTPVQVTTSVSILVNFET